MSSSYDNNEWEAADVSWLSIIGRVIPFLLFFILVSGALAAVFVFFSPADGQAELVFGHDHGHHVLFLIHQDPGNLGRGEGVGGVDGGIVVGT